MKGINMNVTLDVNHVKFPVYFKHRNVCIHCGANGSLQFINMFGDIAHTTHTPLQHIKCMKCGRVYSMRWEPDDNNPDVYKPSAVELNIKQDFMNFISGIEKRGEKVLN